jgi:hypothetical protein
MRLTTFLAAASTSASALYLPRAESSPSQTPLVQDALYDGSVPLTSHPPTHLTNHLPQQPLLLPAPHPSLQPHRLPRHLVPSRRHTLRPHRRRALCDSAVRPQRQRHRQRSQHSDRRPTTHQHRRHSNARRPRLRSSRRVQSRVSGDARGRVPWAELHRARYVYGERMWGGKLKWLIMLVE